METLRELSLFSGYGGFSLGLKLAGLNIRTIGWCDNDKYVQKLLQARIRDGLISDAPVISDIRQFNWGLYRGLVDIITAGFPCQPHSHAGKRAGKDDDRNLWPDTRRCISEVRPRYVLLENVPGLISNGYIGTVVGELSQLGYDATWGIVSAEAVGAPHLRKRWWCLAWLADSQRERFQWGKHERRSRCKEELFEGNGSEVADSDLHERFVLCGQQPEKRQEAQSWISKRGGIPNSELADSYDERSQGVRPDYNPQGWEEPDGQARLCDRTDLGSWWEAEPNVGRVAHGVTSRVDRLKAVGNGIVPAVVAEFLWRIEEE